MGKILKSHFLFKCFIPKLRLVPVYKVPKACHFVTSVSMHKGLHAFRDEKNGSYNAFEKGMYQKPNGVLNAT